MEVVEGVVEVEVGGVVVVEVIGKVMEVVQAGTMVGVKSAS